MATAVPSLKCATEAVVLPVTLEWTIKDFSKLCYADMPPLKSSVYCFEGMDLQLEVKNMSSSGFSVKFCLVSCTYPLPLRAQYDLSYIIRSSEHKYCNNVWFTFASLQNVVGEEGISVSSYIVKDELNIKVSIRFMLQQNHVPKTLKHFTVPECDLKADLSSLLRDGRLSDVTLVAGEQTFPAHTLILAARSPVFEKMFEHAMKESTTSRVGITDIEPPVLQELLLYIYTGELSSKDYKKLFYAADKYQLDRLKVLCELELSTTLSVDNVAECLCLADSHGASQLKEKCVGYIASNRSAVMKTPGWAEVTSRSNLLLEILQAMTTDT